MCISNFHCPQCLKSWRGASYQDYCLECGLKLFPSMSEEDKKILRFNIQAIEDLEQREKYENFYKINSE